MSGCRSDEHKQLHLERTHAYDIDRRHVKMAKTLERDTGTVSLESVLSSGYSVTTSEPSEFPVRLAHSLVSVPKGAVVGLVLICFHFQFAVSQV
ncbi:hypothetical protein CEXT_730761 [Caerostris extrusa]|uniref:Uncharacterized protein n=1 Tax=Caerostris extrusa TaxID=172846 RepID=A0AAV4SA08_CAEEX|nr:hypothetical protein CEXT_730761 [Caerostris extrusa]